MRVKKREIDLAYLAIKIVNGKAYAYMQESYREGGKVHTRTVEYLGAVDPSVADQLKATRKQLGRADMAALVASVGAEAKGIAAGRDREILPGDDTATEPETPPNSTTEPLITTEKKATTTGQLPRFFHRPDDLASYGVGEAALSKTQTRFSDRLEAMGVDPSAMPKVEIVYGHPDGMRRNRDGSYTITAARKPQNKRHQINKTKLWRHTRQATSMAYLDALVEAQPDVHHRLQSELEQSHRETKRLLVQSLAQASSPMEKLSLSLQLFIWHSVPQKLVKRKTAEEFGQASFETLKDWRTEAAFVLAEAHKSGWQGMANRNKKARRKLRTAISRQRNEIDRMGMIERLSVRLSGKRRRIIREIIAKEKQMRGIDQLEHRQKVLKRHFPL